jgi:hypothetical protein
MKTCKLPRVVFSLNLQLIAKILVQKMVATEMVLNYLVYYLFQP